MTFDELYPDAEYGFEIPPGEVPGTMICWRGCERLCNGPGCDRRTEWMELGWLSHLCSEECLAAFNEEVGAELDAINRKMWEREVKERTSEDEGIGF